MTDKEEKLIEFLVKYGQPSNVFINGKILTFILKEPTFETNMTLVIDFQKNLLKEFPKFNFLKKVKNDVDQYWTVLSTE